MKSKTIEKDERKEEIIEYWCSNCGVTEADAMMNCMFCGEFLGAED